MDPARVFVTGASGFLGRAVCARLAADPAVTAVPVARRPVGPEGLQVADYAALKPPAGAHLVHLAETPDIAAFEAEGPAGGLSAA
jgi:nucleoside-diphosphate-sugar epimerase